MDDPRKVLLHQWLADARVEDRREAARLILEKVADEIEKVLQEDHTQH
jgi:hypothetical protein